MKNPFRTEAAAFHFLWGTIGYFGLIAIASLINTWAGVVVFVLETGILVGWWLTTRAATATSPRSRSRLRTRRARSGCS